MRFVNAMYLFTWMAAIHSLTAVAFSSNTIPYPRRSEVVYDTDTPSAIDRQLHRRDEGSLSLDRAWFNEVLFS